MEWKDYCKERLEEVFLQPDSVKTEIWCPWCGAPVYKDMSIILTSYPPKYRYFCSSCKWEETFY